MTFFSSTWLDSSTREAPGSVLAILTLWLCGYFLCFNYLAGLLSRPLYYYYPVAFQQAIKERSRLPEDFYYFISIKPNHLRACISIALRAMHNYNLSHPSPTNQIPRTALPQRHYHRICPTYLANRARRSMAHPSTDRPNERRIWSSSASRKINFSKKKKKKTQESGRGGNNYRYIYRTHSNLSGNLVPALPSVPTRCPNLADVSPRREFRKRAIELCSLAELFRFVLLKFGFR